MASIALAAAQWTAFPVSASAGSVKVTNKTALGPLYVRIIQNSTLIEEFKLQASATMTVNFPAGSTAVAGCGFAQTMTVV